MRSTLLSIISITGLLLLMAACSTTPTITVISDPVTVPTVPVEQRIDPAISPDPFSITIGEIEKINSFDPLFAMSRSGQRLIHLIYDGLTALDQNGNAKPSIAKSWDVSADSLTYTFFLRSDVFFHDDDAFSTGFGRKVNSSDVKFVFRRMASLNVSPNAGELFADHIAGFDAYMKQQHSAYFEEELLIKDIRGIQAPNDSTVIFTLNRPFAGFPALLAHPFASIYPQEVFRARSRGLHTRPVGTGRFSFSHTSGDSVITLSRNFRDFHTGNIANNLTSITVYINENESRMFRKFAAGEVDLLPEIGPLTARTVVGGEHDLKAGYDGTYTLARRGTGHFHLYYLSDNFSGVTKSEVQPLIHFLDSSAFSSIVSPLISFELFDAATGSANPGKTSLKIGYEPDAFISGTARMVASELLEKFDMQLFPLRIPNRDLSLFWSRDGNLNVSGHHHLAEFSYPVYALHSKKLSGIGFNETYWWISLSDAEKAE